MKKGLDGGTAVLLMAHIISIHEYNCCSFDETSSSCFPYWISFVQWKICQYTTFKVDGKCGLALSALLFECLKSLDVQNYPTFREFELDPTVSGNLINYLCLVDD
jgi:hypothetical protein